ncbi:Mu transposase C-terminal domain-containing protein [Brevibacillus borstelensis]|uniref:Mu transposase C-terminal domain-containing protein n=1 Tax=Brevibacillus borstelensis TaxID=45462 RepID=UPI002E1CAD7A|nr:Mu transposase C-terminal domain-containing protein [Brevibacillus borstelensis]
MEKWLTTKEVAELLGVSRQAVHKRAVAGDYTVRRDECDPNKGTRGVRYLIALSSLPEEAQVEYLRQKAKVSKPAAPNDSPQEGKLTVNLAVLEEIGGKDAIQEFTARVNLVRQAINIRSQRGNVVDQLEELCRSVDVKLSTLYKWINSFEKEGEVALLSKPIRKKMEADAAMQLRFGTRGFGSAALDYMTALFLDPRKPKKRYVYNETVQEAERRIAEATNDDEAALLKELWQVGSYQTACRYFNELPDTIISYGQDGVEKWRNKYMTKTLLDYSNLLINQVMVGDHHQLDLFIEHEGRAIRPFFTTFQDARSRVISGWCVSPMNNSNGIGLALRHAALRKPDSPVYGLPVQVYIDNGKDYQSKHLAGGLKHAWKFDYSDETKGVFASLNIEPRYCTARTPWAKGIMERFFKTFTTQFAMHIPGFCGSNNKDRPEGFDEKKLLKQGKLLTLEQLAERIEAYLDKYHNTIHSELKDTPLNVYQQTPKAREGVPDARAFDILLMRSKKRKVYTVGVRFQGKYYTHPALDYYVGEDVIVRYDPSHLDEIMIFRGTSYLCTAHQNYTEFGDMDQLELHMQRQKRSARAIKDAVKGYKDRAAKHHYTGSVDESGKGDMITGYERAAQEIAADQQAKTETSAEIKPQSIREQWLEKQGRKALGLA